MPSAELTKDEWQQLLTILATTKEWPWTVTNPLLMKLGQQLDSKQQTNSQETIAAQGEVVSSRAN